MAPREKITPDWKQWEPSRLAFALEAHLIPPKQRELRGVPKKLMQEFGSEPFTGIGYHYRTGWFVLACGQGPMLVYVEKNG